VWSREGFPESGDKLLLATGGERNHGLTLAREAGMEAAAPVPAYVRLRLTSPKLGDRLGPLSRQVRLSCPATGLCETGAGQFSSRGLEGEVLSRLACQLCEGWSQRGYRLALNVDWVPEVSPAALRGELASRSEGGRRKPIGDDPLFGFTPRQWRVFLELARIEADLPWGRLKPKKLQTLVQRLKAHALKFDGMGLPSGERAWAGGLDLRCVDPGTGACLRSPGLHVAGEMLDMLGMPGGRQLNLVWASGYVAGSAMALSA
jgi:predicted flavoprotein YhiN